MLHSNDSKVYQRIWSAVLWQIVKDLMGADGRNNMIRLDAERWVGNYPTAAFKETCGNAKIDHNVAFDWMHALCQIPVEARRDTVRGRIVGPDAITAMSEAA